MSDEPISTRRRTKRLAERLAPRDSGARSALRMARQMGRDAVEYMPRARSIWRLASQPAAVEPGYADWLSRNRVTPGQIAHQIELTTADPRPVVIEIIVLPSVRTGTGSAARRPWHR